MLSAFLFLRPREVKSFVRSQPVGGRTRFQTKFHLVPKLRHGTTSNPPLRVLTDPDRALARAVSYSGPHFTGDETEVQREWTQVMGVALSLQPGASSATSSLSRHHKPLNKTISFCPPASGRGAVSSGPSPPGGRRAYRVNAQARQHVDEVFSGQVSGCPLCIGTASQSCHRRVHDTHSHLETQGW